MAQTAMTVRMDSQQKILFDQLCEQFGMSANAAINVFVKAVIRTKSIPFTIKVKEGRKKMRLRLRLKRLFSTCVKLLRSII